MRKILHSIFMAFLLVGSVAFTAQSTHASPSPAFTLRVYEDGFWDEYHISTADTIEIFIHAQYGNLELKINGVNTNTRSDWMQITNVQHAFTMTDESSYTEYVPISQFMDINLETDGGDIWIYDNSGTIGGAYVPVLYFIFDQQPVLSGETAFVTNVDSPITEAQIRSYITAYDETDGNITHLIQKTSDNYTPNMNKLGEWTINYSVQDTSGNTATLTVTVLVRDVTAPTWNQAAKENVSISYTQTFNIEGYKTQLGYADNYHATGTLVVTVHSNTYTANKTVPGTYQVVYKILDPSGNFKLATVNVTVIDDVAPVFSGPTTIAKPNTTTMTLSQIKAQLTASDVIAGNVTASIVVIEDNYTGKGHLVGSYTIKFSVTDPSGNTAQHTITMNVEDNLPPIFYVRDNFFISVESTVALTLQDIIDILQITGQLNPSGTGGTQITTLVNEYLGNESTPGIYAISLQASSVNGNESIYNVAIEVVSETESPIIIDDPTMEDVLGFVNANLDYIIGGAVILLLGVVLIIRSKKKDRKTNVKRRNKKRRH